MKSAVRVGVVLAGILALLSALAVFGVVATDMPPRVVVDVAVTPQAYLPFVGKPQPTPFATPGPVQRYHMEYAIQGSEPYLWMPVPSSWDGNGVRQTSIRENSPPPTDRYTESNGTEIVYWENPAQTTQVFKVVFDAELGYLEYGLDQEQEWPPYDVNSELYKKNTASTTWVQVDHPEIQGQASTIIGDETNPYRQAYLIHRWVQGNIAYSCEDLPEDALSVLRNRIGGCGGKANLFVALCRASSIPARNVTGITSRGQPTFTSGSWQDGTLGTHVWAEFYLPGLGWIQDDTGSTESGWNDFATIREYRIVTAKGSDIWLGHDHFCGELSWFHMPHANNSHPVCQTIGDRLWLTVTQLP